MSLAEIKAELKTMTRAERMTLVEYLEILNRLDDPNVRGEVNAAMQRMDAGRKVTEEEVLAAGTRPLKVTGKAGTITDAMWKSAFSENS